MGVIPFDDATRHMVGSITETKAKGSAVPLNFTLRKIGILAGLYVRYTGTIAGTLSNLNAFGKSCLIKEIAVEINGTPLHKFSGPGYHWYLRDFIDTYEDPCIGTDARSAVAAAAFDVSMFVPIAVNARDHMGLVPLQTDRSQVNVYVTPEDDAVVATGATVTGDVVIIPELFQQPANPKSWPEYAFLHSIIEEQKVLSGAGDHTVELRHGNTYLQHAMLYGAGVSAADNWSKVEYQAGAEKPYVFTPGSMDRVYERSHGRARPKGQIVLDLMGSSGLGMFGSDRDVVFSPAVADFQAVLTATAGGTLRMIRRELVQIRRT